MSYTVTVTIDAPVVSVWDRLVDIGGWPSWNPACVSAAADGPLVAGTRLRLELRLPRGRTFWTAPILSELVAPRRLVLETRALGLRAATIVMLSPEDARTGIRLTSESRGPLGFAYRLTFPEKTQAQMWSGALTGLARSFAGPPGTQDVDHHHEDGAGASTT